LLPGKCPTCERAERTVFYEDGRFVFFWPFLVHSGVQSYIRKRNIVLDACYGQYVYTYVLSHALEIMCLLGLHPAHHKAMRKAIELFSWSFASQLEYKHKVDAVPPSPAGLKYAPFQERSVGVMATEIRKILAGESKLKGILLADEMGTGKTIQAIGLINSLPEAKKIIVLTPAIMVGKFADHLRTWLTRHLAVLPIGNKILSKRGREELMARLMRNDLSYGSVQYKMFGPKSKVGSFDGFVLVTNYEFIKAIKPLLEQVEFDLLIADEAHYLKNPKAQRTKFVIGDNSKKKKEPPLLKYKAMLLMTGTPGTSSVRDICYLAHACAPREFVVSETLMRYAGLQLDSIYTKYGRKMIYVEREMRPEERSELLREFSSRLLATIMIRRLKSQVVTELPEKVRELFVLPETQELLKLAQKERNIALEALSAMRSGQNRKLFITKMTELSQARRETAQAKVLVLKDHIENLMENAQKVVVFCYHREIAELVAKMYNCKYVHGDMDTNKRMEVIQEFREEIRKHPDKGAMIALTMSSCGVGIDIPEAQVALFVEMDWLPSTIVQAEDRLYRIGQTKNVLCQYIVAAHTVDERIAYRVLERSKNLSLATGDMAPGFELGGETNPEEAIGGVLEDLVHEGQLEESEGA
jgi:SWI/SNF-related matrix-associated actin-dependent regulator 1 of chromatin subfamily A